MDEGLRAELLRRVEPDQAARKARDLDAMLAVDGANLPWLKDVIAGHGWPGESLVGTNGAHATWLLAQHADTDLVFQRQCLDLLAAAVEAGEATVIELAYLTDRVLLHEGQPQVYGTQLTRDASGRMVPCDALTAKRGYLLMSRGAGQPVTVTCPGCGREMTIRLQR